MRIGEKITNPGEMRTTVQIQTRTMSVSGGFATPTWATVATVKARWVNVHGGEVWTSQAVGAIEPATVLLRWRPDIDTTCAILKDSIRYEIVSADDIQERHEYMELKLRRMAAG